MKKRVRDRQPDGGLTGEGTYLLVVEGLRGAVCRHSEWRDDRAALVIGILRIRLQLPGSGSLKAKRQVVAALLKLVRNEFAVAAAEIGEGDRWQLAELGIACVSNDPRHADEVIARVLRFVEARAREAVIANVSTEVLRLS